MKNEKKNMVQYEGEFVLTKEENRPAHLKDNIHIILYGSKSEKDKLKGQNFYLADTSVFLKKYGLTGDFFTVRYGVISRHKGKYIAVGINVKNTNRGIEVNSVATAFGYDQREHEIEEIMYRSKKLTPEQAALLDGLNSLSLPPEQGSISNIS